MNYDLMKTAKATFNMDIRNELAKASVLQLLDEEFPQKFADQSSFKEENKYMNWYLGCSKLNLPSVDSKGAQFYDRYTTATVGSMSSPWFGEEFTDKFISDAEWNYNIELSADLSSVASTISSNLFLVVEMRLDILEKDEGDNEMIILSGIGGYKWLQWLGNVNKTNRYQVTKGKRHQVIKEKKLTVKFIRKDEKHGEQWRMNKRHTGYALQWHYENKNGERVSC